SRSTTTGGCADDPTEQPRQRTGVLLGRREPRALRLPGGHDVQQPMPSMRFTRPRVLHHIEGAGRMTAWGGRHAQTLVALTLATYGTRCRLCLQPGATTADHVVPRSRGGDNSLDNLRPAHSLCNSRRGDRTIAWFRARYCPELVAASTIADAAAFFETATDGH